MIMNLAVADLLVVIAPLVALAIQIVSNGEIELGKTKSY